MMPRIVRRAAAFTKGHARVTIKIVLPRGVASLIGCLLVAACGGGRSVPPEPTQQGVNVRSDPPPTPTRLASFPGRYLPVLTRRENTVENLFGHMVADPYRWLENGESEEVKKWTEEQNALTRRVLDRVRDRDKLHDRLSELLSIGTVTAPVVRKLQNGRFRYLYTRREGDQNQPVLYVRDGIRGADQVLIDPNLFSSDGTTALDWWSPSNDGKLLAFGLSQNGDEESTLYLRDVEKKEDLPDKIERTRFASIAWLPDNKSFYYTRHPKKGTVPEGEEPYHRNVFWHKLGDDPEKDAYVFGKGRKITDWPGVDVSPNGRWLVVTVHQEWTRNEVYIKDLRNQPHAGFTPLVAGIDARFDPTVRNDVIYIRTNDGAPRYKLYAVDPKRPERRRWKEVLAEGADVLDSVSVVGSDVIATYLADASSKIRRFSPSGVEKGEVDLPTLGSTSSISGRWDGDEAFYEFSSFAVPPAIYRLDLRSGKSEVWEAIEAPIDPFAFQVERIRGTSKDGTKIPLFVVHKKGLVKDGVTPTVLTGYGGFNTNIVPTFTRSSYLLLERGGILAVANLRGGGEFGEQWHREGMRDKKQNVFDDAVAAASELVASRYTDPAHLAVMGGSNGGLLVGALITQRPSLFRAAVCSVPLLDMLRYHKFRIAKLWTPEYGSPDDPKEFEWLYAYSPYHQVRPGTQYPAVLFTTAESDSRVDPLHARKMAAAMQAATTSEHPILLRVETKAGHGAGKPKSKIVEELTDVYSFLFAELDVGIPP